MTAFGRSLGLETNGQQLKSLKDQLARLASASVRMGVVEEGRAVQVQTHFVSAFDLWFPKQSDQRMLWPSTVRLSEEYFQSLGKHAVPLDHRAVAALASSSMALDVYVWLAQRLHRVPAGPAAVHHLGRPVRAVRAGLRTGAGFPPAVPPHAASGPGRLSERPAVDHRGRRQPRKQPAAGSTPVHRDARGHARRQAPSGHGKLVAPPTANAGRSHNGRIAETGKGGEHPTNP